MQLSPKTSPNLLLKEKNSQESELFSDEALEDDLELNEDLEDLPI